MNKLLLKAANLVEKKHGPLDIDGIEKIKRIVEKNYNVSYDELMSQYEKEEITGEPTKINKYLSNLPLSINPSARYKKARFFLDSTKQSAVSSLDGKMRWNISLNGVGDNAVNLPISKIIGMRMGSVVMYGVENYFSNLAIYGYYGNMAQRRISISIEEFYTQSFIAKHYFRFRLTMKANLVPDANRYINDGELFEYLSVDEMTTQTQNDGYFWFREPFNPINTITMSMGVPCDPNYMPHSRIIGTYRSNVFLIIRFIVSNTYNNLYGNLGTKPLYWYRIPMIRVSGFTTGDPVADADLITRVNSTAYPADLYVVINDAVLNFEVHTLQINVDTSSATPFDGEKSITVDVSDCHRMVFPLELIYYE